MSSIVEKIEEARRLGYLNGGVLLESDDPLEQKKWRDAIEAELKKEEDRARKKVEQDRKRWMDSLKNQHPLANINTIKSTPIVSAIGSTAGDTTQPWSSVFPWQFPSEFDNRMYPAQIRPYNPLTSPYTYPAAPSEAFPSAGDNALSSITFATVNKKQQVMDLVATALQYIQAETGCPSFDYKFCESRFVSPSTQRDVVHAYLEVEGKIVVTSGDCATTHTNIEEEYEALHTRLLMVGLLTMLQKLDIVL